MWPTLVPSLSSIYFLTSSECLLLSSKIYFFLRESLYLCSSSFAFRSSAVLCYSLIYSFLYSSYLEFYSITFYISRDFCIDLLASSILSADLPCSNCLRFSSTFSYLSSYSLLCLEIAVSAAFLVNSIFKLALWLFASAYFCLSA